MTTNKPYAYLKTLCGNEVMAYTKTDFKQLIQKLHHTIVRHHDRILYFITTNEHTNGIFFFKDDYIEVMDN